MKKVIIFFIVIFGFVFASNLDASTVVRPDSVIAQWICYPGEFGIWVHKELMSRRTERNQPVPSTLARIDVPYGVVSFEKHIKLAVPEKAILKVDGEFYIKGVGKNNAIMYDFEPLNFELPAGEYTIGIVVKNYKTLPSIWFNSKSYKSDNSWFCSALNDDRVHTEALSLEGLNMPPSLFKLNTTAIEGVILKQTNTESLYDFGKETFGFPLLKGLKGIGSIHLFYGESKEEALAGKLAETWDKLDVNTATTKNDTLATKAFRYVNIVKDTSVKYDSFSALYEFLPLEKRGQFKCSDEQLNKIYDVSYYTLQLCTREVHIDGVKRDRWAWSGDAYQSYLMNFYSFFDQDVNKRTLWGMRGHEPQTKHLNSILDYSFYWMIGIYNHYLYTGNAEFVKQIYPRLKSTMDFCLSRLNKNGIAEGLPSDWVFVDWAPIDKTGEISFEQLLLIQSLTALKYCAEVVGDEVTKNKMNELYANKLKQFDKIFWSEAKGAYLHNRKNGKLSENATRYTNMFSVLFGLADETRKQQIKTNILLNDSILGITTPYMKFYELAALCEVGEQKKVLDYVKTYWGGMLKLGATSVWETYEPTLPDTAHYAMYGRPFGKSLCHAWGANPVYLFGRYFLGVYPNEPGYKTYIVEPKLGGLKWMEGTVPTPNGDIKVNVTPTKISVLTANSTGGELRFSSQKMPKVSGGTLLKLNAKNYVLKLNKANTSFEILIK